jgi:hypothetical protein
LEQPHAPLNTEFAAPGMEKWQMLIGGIDAGETRAGRRCTAGERDLAAPGSLPSWFHRVDRTRFAHRTMGQSVEETDAASGLPGPSSGETWAKWAMKVERVEIVFAASARQRVKKTSPVLLSVPNWAPGSLMSSPARDEMRRTLAVPLRLPRRLSRSAQAGDELIVRRVLDWLQKYPASGAPPKT